MDPRRFTIAPGRFQLLHSPARYYESSLRQSKLARHQPSPISTMLDLHALYQKVIDDVISKVEPEFQHEGLDE